MSALRLAWALFALWAVLAALNAALAYDALGRAAFATVGFALVGALVAARRPANPIGWLLLAEALLWTASGAIEGYGVPAETATQRPGGELALWASGWIYYVALGVAGVALPLLFPDGRPPSPRWRWVLWLGALAVGLAVLTSAFGDAALEGYPGVANPLAVAGPVGDVLARLDGVAEVPLVVAFLAALAGLVVRLRRARGTERQQVKACAYVVALMLVGLVLAAGGEIGAGDAERGAPAVIEATGWWLFIVALAAGLPAAVGAAILRHRLFDIDLVIRRTLVYGGLTAILAAAYLALVLLLGLALGEGSGLSVAGSTLAVAALAGPARTRIQGLVARRFYRGRYDAARTLEAFGARLRVQVELDAVAADLRGVARDTLQPAHVSVWLRPRSGP